MTTVVKTEGRHKEEFLVSEGNGSISRDAATLASGQKVTDGTVLVFSAGKLQAAAGTLNSSNKATETFAGIVSGSWDASSTGTNADITGVPYIARYAEYNPNRVTLYSGSDSTHNTAIKAALAALGLIARA